MKETKILSSFKDGKLVINAPYKDKPIILIFPGGGYHHLADREAYPVSEKFIGIGEIGLDYYWNKDFIL
mgnify:CR=1 FL=1